MAKEVFTNFGDYYAVSTYGNVTSCVVGGEMSLRVTSAGYRSVNLRVGGRERTFRVHRLVAILFLDNPEGLPQVNHKDGNKLNNHVDNLEWVTAADNVKHAFDTGLAKGRPGKLTEEDIRSIRELADSMTGAAIGELFGVHQGTIHGIVTRRTWKHVA